MNNKKIVIDSNFNNNDIIDKIKINIPAIINYEPYLTLTLLISSILLFSCLILSNIGFFISTLALISYIIIYCTIFRSMYDRSHKLYTNNIQMQLNNIFDEYIKRYKNTITEYFNNISVNDLIYNMDNYIIDKTLCVKYPIISSFPKSYAQSIKLNPLLYYNQQRINYNHTNTINFVYKNDICKIGYVTIHIDDIPASPIYPCTTKDEKLINIYKYYTKLNPNISIFFDKDNIIFLNNKEKLRTPYIDSTFIDASINVDLGESLFNIDYNIYSAKFPKKYIEYNINKDILSYISFNTKTTQDKLNIILEDNNWIYIENKSKNELIYKKEHLICYIKYINFEEYNINTENIYRPINVNIFIQNTLKLV